VLSIAWAVTLAGAVLPSTDGRPPGWAAVVYMSASKVCHQRPERSFHAGHAQWPVCARCAGLYLAAPIGAIAALGRRRRVRLTWVAAAALPTALTWILETAGLAPVGNLARFLAALPLGAAIAMLAAGTAAGKSTLD
jgi:uncharacterized membrane protein